MVKCPKRIKCYCILFCCSCLQGRPSITSLSNILILANVSSCNTSVSVKYQVQNQVRVFSSLCLSLSPSLLRKTNSFKTTQQDWSVPCSEDVFTQQCVLQTLWDIEKAYCMYSVTHIVVLLFFSLEHNLFLSTALLRRSVILLSNSRRVWACKCCKALRMNVDLAV